MTGARTGKDIYKGCTKKGYYFWVMVKLTFVVLIAYLLLWLLITSPSGKDSASMEATGTVNRDVGAVGSRIESTAPYFKSNEVKK